MKIRRLTSFILALSLFLFIFWESESRAEGEYDFINGVKTSIQRPFKLRDPFKRPITATKEEVQKETSSIVKKGNLYTNIHDDLRVPVEKMTVTGVLLGNRRKATVRIEGRPSLVTLEEGMKVGEKGQAEVKAILPGGVVIAEKFKNIYDQVEYIETILPIRTGISTASNL